MKGLTPRTVAGICGGSLSGNGQLFDREISAIETDSRKVTEGCMFAAIKGNRVDGHSFIGQVTENGAACVLCERLPEQHLDEKAAFILVPSTLEALKAIAQAYLASRNIPVIGITGSVGKTSTKEMIAAVLSQKFRTLKTQGNFNNELGLPLTIFRLRDEEIAVLEMGISNFGEMHILSGIARPQTCVITNIGQCHLENLGDRDGVLRAKSEIFDYLLPGGHIILNGDDDKLASVQEVKGIRPVFFGLDEESDVYADHIETLGLSGVLCCIHTKIGDFSATIPIPGIHMVYNALAGTAVGLQFGLTLEEIKAGIESLEPVTGRFHIIKAERCTVIDDCYNANPVSMKASLGVLRDAVGRKVAVLGDMAELGAEEKELHREVGEYAAGLGLDVCVTVGPLCRELAAGIRAGNSRTKVIEMDTLQELLRQIENIVKPGDTVLVKASHCMHFEKIVEKLTCIS